MSMTIATWTTCRSSGSQVYRSQVTGLSVDAGYTLVSIVSPQATCGLATCNDTEEHYRMVDEQRTQPHDAPASGPGGHDRPAGRAGRGERGERPGGDERPGGRPRRFGGG